jgi:hypothetical protein
VIADRHANLFTRAANDWSDRFKPLCAAFAGLKVSSAVIDGEVVHVAADGSMSFHGLQNALSTERLDQLRWSPRLPFPEPFRSPAVFVPGHQCTDGRSLSASPDGCPRHQAGGGMPRRT